MTDLLRQEIATSANPIVVKVGSRVLTRPNGRLDQERIVCLSGQLAMLRGQGRRVVMVSSGAVAAGMGRLGITRRPTDLAHLQAVAAVGQSHLIESYDRALRGHGHHAAQVLLTAEDLNDRTRYLNVRNTIFSLFDLQAIPILNENDTVSVEELQISFGDNDRLAAMVTNLIRAPLLILLSDVEGLYDGDPADPASRLIPTVTRLDDATRALALDHPSKLGKGGMASKLEAARIATAAGETVVIAGGRRDDVLSAIVRGESIGTLILARGQAVTSRKRWIGFAARPVGAVVLDEGACRAILQQGRSLLAIGVVDVIGDFRKGDVVSLRRRDGTELARGLCNYHAAEVRRIGGLRTDQIADVLGHRPYYEVIHRNNLAFSA